jgi:hypothetical protein
MREAIGFHLRPTEENQIHVEIRVLSLLNQTIVHLLRFQSEILEHYLDPGLTARRALTTLGRGQLVVKLRSWIFHHGTSWPYLGWSGVGGGCAIGWCVLVHGRVDDILARWDGKPVYCFNKLRRMS